MFMRVALVWALVILACCLLPGSERVELDRKVGVAQADGVRIEVLDGLASVRSLSGSRAELWAQAPVLQLVVDATDSTAGSLRLDVLNCMPDAQLVTPRATLTPVAAGDHAASCRFDVPLQRTEERWLLGPRDAREEEPYVFAVLSDIQRAVNEVQDVFTRINQQPDVRFVVSTGDLVNTGARPELVRFQQEMRTLRVPMFSTVGNHEMGAPFRHWHQLFGPFNVHFAFKGARFSLVDSGNATIDPEVYDWLHDWLEQARTQVHVVLTHIPPLDPVGLRGGSFRSRKEAAKFMKQLGDGRADVLFLGHIHSYYAFSIAGVPTYISGGGGAIEEELDGIGRHFLKVRVRPGVGVEEVAVVRVD